jgi:enoyl-[acyl-carrier-protein] reductase (NADH)
MTKVKKGSKLKKFIDKRINKRINEVLDARVTNLVASIDASDNNVENLANHVNELESEFRHEVHVIQDDCDIPELRREVENITYTLENEVPNEDSIEEIVDAKLTQALQGHDIDDIFTVISTVETIKEAIGDFARSVDYA